VATGGAPENAELVLQQSMSMLLMLRKFAHVDTTASPAPHTRSGTTSGYS